MLTYLYHKCPIDAIATKIKGMIINHFLFVFSFFSFRFAIELEHLQQQIWSIMRKIKLKVHPGNTICNLVLASIFCRVVLINPGEKFIKEIPTINVSLSSL